MRQEIEDLLVEMYDNFPKDASEDTKSDFWSDLSDLEKYKVNEKHLRQIGNPEYDYLVCWEPGRFNEDENVTDFDTMYDVDLSWWEFQKQARWESIEDMKQWMEKNPSRTTPESVAKSINAFNDEYDKGYNIYLSGDWYRLIENEIFLYSQFISAKWYLFYEAENFLDELLEKHIPHTFRDNDDLLNFISNINERDPRKIYEASGRELELDSYKDKIRDYQSNDLIKRINFIIKKYSIVFSGKTFRVDTGYTQGEDFDPFTNFIFFDEESLKNVFPKKFLKTFKQNQLDFVEFDKMTNELKDLVLQDFNKIYMMNKLKFSE